MTNGIIIILLIIYFHHGLIHYANPILIVVLTACGTNLKRNAGNVRFNGALRPWPHIGLGDNGVRTQLQVGIAESLTNGI